MTIGKSIIKQVASEIHVNCLSYDCARSDIFLSTSTSPNHEKAARPAWHETVQRRRRNERLLYG